MIDPQLLAASQRRRAWAKAHIGRSRVIRGEIVRGWAYPDPDGPYETPDGEPVRFVAWLHAHPANYAAEYADTRLTSGRSTDYRG